MAELGLSLAHRGRRHPAISWIIRAGSISTSASIPADPSASTVPTITTLSPRIHSVVVWKGRRRVSRNIHESERTQWSE
jgi:hypothetical protein